MVITPADANTPKLIGLLEASLGVTDDSLEPTVLHPALLHLYCHAMELSPTPERAVPVANALWKTMPDAGHLVHMPSHIYAWAGMWNEGVNCNKEGVAADERYRVKEFTEEGKETGSQFYKFYRMHNMHFVVWCAMHEGRYGEAMEYARKAEAQNPAGADGVEFMLAGIIPMGAVFLESYVNYMNHYNINHYNISHPECLLPRVVRRSINLSVNPSYCTLLCTLLYTYVHPLYMYVHHIFTSHASKHPIYTL